MTLNGYFFIVPKSQACGSYKLLVENSYVKHFSNWAAYDPVPHHVLEVPEGLVRSIYSSYQTNVN